jgi:hypothetical protein
MQDKRKLTLIGASMAVVVTLLAGCATTSKDERSEGRITDDQNITRNVQTALDQEPVYKFEGVNVKTFAGIVQLSGFVNVNEQRQRAQDIASRQEGVVKVVNSLALKPQMVPTGRVEQQPRIYSSPDLNQNQNMNQNQIQNQQPK